MVSEVKKDVVEIIVAALQKILAKGLSKDIDQKYIDQVLKDIK